MPDNIKKIKKLLEFSKDRSLATFDELTQISEGLDQVNQTFGDLNMSELINKAVTLKGDKGDMPVKGKDYFTFDEIEQFKQEVTPVKGIDYRDGIDGKDGESIVGPPGPPGLSGQDADPNEVVGLVIEKLPKIEQLQPDTPDQIKAKLESLKKDKRLDSSAIKGLPDEIVSKKDLDWQLGVLSKRTDFLISRQTSSSTGSGDMVGPSSSVDNSVVRFDGTTGKLLQDSGAVINDVGVLSTANVFATSEQFSGNIRYGYHAFYNGGTSGIDYSIGQAFSTDGVYWQRDLNNPLLSPVASTWEANVVKDPWIVVVDNIYYLYYAGWRSSTNRFQIGLAISKDYGQTYTKYSGNPIITNGGAGTVDERRAMFPLVIYEADEADANKKWKMWYAGRDGSDVERIAYATSADGIVWTKFGQVMDLGASGQFDDTALQTGSVVKISGTYYFFYAGYTLVGGRSKFSTGLATFTDPEGTYTRQGEVLTGLTTKDQDLTADTLTGSAVVTIADTSVFEANEYVYLGDTDSQPMLSRISSIDSATQLTLRDVATADFTTANSAAIRSVYQWSTAGRSVFRENGHWTMAVTIYQTFSDMSYLRELSGWATNSNDLPTGSWTFDIKRGVALENLAGSWETVSSENFSIIPLRFIPILGGVGIGDVVGPASAGDNMLTRYDATTGKLIQSSGVLLSDTNMLSPSVADNGGLGTSALPWSDAYFASGAVLNFNAGNATLTHSASLLTSNVNIAVPDDAYGAGWNGSANVPTKNAVYDKIESLVLGTGDVVGPSSATDNAIARFDGTTGKLQQNSTVTINDDGTLTIPTSPSAGINALTLTGSWFAGSTPLVLFKDPAASAVSYSSSGVGFALNGPSGFNGHMMHLAVNGSTVGYLSAGGTWGGSNFSNLSSTNNALITTASTGTTIARNVADANPAVIISQTHASSTGDIVRFNNFAGTVVKVLQTGSIVSTMGTLTTSIPVLDATQTWNSSGVTFTGIKLNVTNTASAVGSKLVDLQLGGASQFYVDRLGNVGINFSGNATGRRSWAFEGDSNTSFSFRRYTDNFAAASATIWFTDNSVTTDTFRISAGTTALISTSNFGWYNDLYLARDAADTFAQRRTTTAQKSRIYNTFTTVDTAGEWFKFDWKTTANQFRFGAVNGSSSGTARVATWDYGGVEATPTAAISVPITSGAITFGGGLLPASSDGGALGSSTLMWSDLFLASGAVIDFNNGDVVLTHSSDALTMTGGKNFIVSSTGAGTTNVVVSSDTGVATAIRFRTSASDRWVIAKDGGAETGSNAGSNFSINRYADDGTLLDSPFGVLRSSGAITLPNLAGTGSRAVLADATGILSAPISDVTVKENVKPLDYGIAEIAKMNPVSYEFKDGWKNYGEGRQIGLIAQELEKIIPEVVFTTPGNGKKGIKYETLVPILIKAIQELALAVKILK